MLSIDVIVPARGSRLWHQTLIERLQTAGHDIAIIPAGGAPAWPRSMVTALAETERERVILAARGSWQLTLPSVCMTWT